MLELTRPKRDTKTKTTVSGTRRIPILRWSHLQWRDNVNWLLMALPALIWVFVFSYLPMGGVIVAFKQFRAADGILGSQWVGLSNFRFLFGSDKVLQVTKNTVLMNSLFIVIGLVVALLLAMLLYEIRDHHVTRYYPTVLIFPFFLSWVIISSMVYAFLSPSVGLVNGLLTRFGIEPVMWYFRPEYWRVILTIVNLWATVGYGVVIYYSGMLAINPEYFEAAMVDGASGWRRMWHITLPLLSPLIIINVLLAIGNMFRANFMLFYLVPRNSGPLLSTTDVLDTYVYRALTGASGGSTMLGGGAVGMAAAAGLYQALVGLVLVLVSNWIIRRLDRDKALF